MGALCWALGITPLGSPICSHCPTPSSITDPRMLHQWLPSPHMQMARWADQARLPHVGIIRLQAGLVVAGRSLLPGRGGVISIDYLECGMDFNRFFIVWPGWQMISYDLACISSKFRWFGVEFHWFPLIWHGFSTDAHGFRQILQNRSQHRKNRRWRDLESRLINANWGWKSLFQSTLCFKII